MIPNHNYKVVWAYRGMNETVTEMYDKPKRLCLWWIKEHKSDPLYRDGKLCLVSMMKDKTS